MDTPAITPARPFRVWPYLLVNLVAAIWLDFTQFHILQTSDSVVFVLASLYEMRIFFWEQDRIGMLIPLLNSWCGSPYHNLLLQTGAMIFLGLSMPLFLARVLTPHRMAPLAITLGNALFLLLAPDLLHENWLLVCNYPSALLFGFAAFGLIDDRPSGRSWPLRTLCVVGCTALLVIAHWQYFGVVIFLGALVAFRAWTKSGPGATTRIHGWVRTLFRPLFDLRFLTIAPLIWLALGAITLLMIRVRDGDPIVVNTSSAGIPTDEWIASWKGLIATTWALPGMSDYAAVLGAFSAAGLLFALTFERRTLGQILRAILPALLAATLELFILGTREWTTMNEYHPRYLVSVTTTTLVALALAGFVPVLSRIPRRFDTHVMLLAGALLLAGATGRYGWPSQSGVRTLIDERFGALTPAVIESGCEAVGGDYWVVWLAMFHADMTLYERGDPRVIFGVGARCDAMKSRWGKYPAGFRIAMPADGNVPHVEASAMLRGLEPFVKIGERGTVVLPSHPHAPARPATIGIYRSRPAKGE
jgi:hypothetical protein